MNVCPSSALRRARFILWLAGAALLLAAVFPLGGRPLIGFRYRARVDNTASVCPRRVVAQAGDHVTLDDGRVLRVIGLAPSALQAELAGCGGYVRVEDGWLRVRRALAACGNRPERGQWLTVPLIRAEQVNAYYAAPLAEARPAEEAHNGR